MIAKTGSVWEQYWPLLSWYVLAVSYPEYDFAKSVSNALSPGRLHRSQRPQVGFHARHGLCGHHVAHRLCRRPSCSHSAPYWRIEVGQSIGFRGHWPSSVESGTSAVYEPGSQYGREQGTRARHGEALLSESEWRMEVGGTQTGCEVERI